MSFWVVVDGGAHRWVHCSGIVEQRAYHALQVFLVGFRGEGGRVGCGALGSGGLVVRGGIDGGGARSFDAVWLHFAQELVNVPWHRQGDMSGNPINCDCHAQVFCSLVVDLDLVQLG